MIKLSIIIVNYNVRYFLQQCLQSVVDACKNLQAEIIVVDNNSVDLSCEMVKEMFPQVKLIANKINTGFSTANNLGVALAKGEYVLILNPDTVVAEDTFEKILKYAETKVNLGALGVKLIDGTGNFLPESKRSIPTPIVALKKLIGFDTNKYYANHLSEDESGKIEILVGAFMFIKRSIYNKVKGFDEDYFMYGEDIDLSYKILKAGYDNYYFSLTKIIHYKGESTKKDISYFNNFYGAMQLFYKKHFQINGLSRFVLDFGIKTFKLIKQTKINSANKENKAVKKFIYIGKNASTFSKIKSKLKAEVAINHQEIMINDILINKVDTIIFDTNFIPYKAIFNSMELLKNKQIRFRFIPKNSDFFIGSDTSIGKGKIIEF